MIRSALTNETTGAVSHKRLIAFMLACLVVVVVVGEMFGLSVPEYMFTGLLLTVSGLVGGSITESVIKSKHDEKAKKEST